MIRRLLLTLALCLAALAPAKAQLNLGWGGMLYPPVQVQCTTYGSDALCTSATWTWTVPNVSYSGTGGGEGILEWLGSYGGTTGCGTGASHECLLQFGLVQQVTTGNVKTNTAFFERECAAGCENIQTISGFVPSDGDRLEAEFACVTNCTSNNAGVEVSVVLIDLTTSTTCYVDPVAKACGVQCVTGSEESCFNFPVSFEQVTYVAEFYAGANGTSLAAPLTTSGATVNGAPVTFTALGSSAIYENVGSGGAARAMFPSIPIHGSADFNICIVTGTFVKATPTLCPGGAYGGTSPGLGP